MGASALLLCAVLSPVWAWQAAFEPHYDVIVLGTGLKESLLTGLLANSGKRVLQLERKERPEWASVDLEELAERTEAPKPTAKAVGPLDEYSVDAAPRVFLASGAQLQMLVKSGAWSHMDFKRVHRSLLYRKRPDGSMDIHRVLANSEDVLKTRSLKPLDKARVMQLFLWVDRYDEDNEATHVAGVTTKRTLDLYKMNAASFFKFWELPQDAVQMIARGLALFTGPTKMLKKLPAAELVRRLKRYKDAYKTFTHMTSPYVYPVGGFGAELPKAVSAVLEDHEGAQLMGRPIDRVRPQADPRRPPSLQSPGIISPRRPLPGALRLSATTRAAHPPCPLRCDPLPSRRDRLGLPLCARSSSSTSQARRAEWSRKGCRCRRTASSPRPSTCLRG